MHKKAFTLIELLLVILIISLLIAALLGAYGGSLRAARVNVGAETLAAFINEQKTRVRTGQKFDSAGVFEVGCYGVRLAVNDLDENAEQDEELRVIETNYDPDLAHKCVVAEDGDKVPFTLPVGVNVRSVRVYSRDNPAVFLGRQNPQRIVVQFVPPDGEVVFTFPEEIGGAPVKGVDAGVVAQAEIMVSYFSETDPDSALVKLIVVDGFSGAVSVF